MLKEKLTEEMKETIQEQPKLRGYLVSLSKAKKETERSWLYDGEHGNVFMSTDAVLGNWIDQLESLNRSDNPVLVNVYQFDISQKEKWGPQGGRPAIDDLTDICEAGFKMGDDAKRTPAFRTGKWKRAKMIASARLRKAGAQSLRPASYEKVVDDMKVRDTLESKSGWPENNVRKNPATKARAIADARSGKWRTYPAIALFRNYNQKLRLVWMFPMAANLVEGSYFQPLQSALIDSELGSTFFSPWKGFEVVRSCVTRSYRGGDVVSASDFSSTDEHFQKSATSEVCDVIETCFQAQYRAGLRESLMYMHEIPLVIGTEYMITGDHGVSSGSNWTNFVETVFDFILSIYVNLVSRGKVSGLYAIGDDMSWVSTTDYFGDKLKKLLEDIGHSVGQQIKADKTTSERDQVKTLQRLFQRGYYQENSQLLRGVYPTVRALKSLVFPERFHDPRKWSADMFCVRCFMILENCVDHPMFKEFVAYVCAGNEHLIPFAHKSAEELIAAQVQARQVHGLTETYNQEKRDQSLANFASIRVAANL